MYEVQIFVWGAVAANEHALLAQHDSAIVLCADALLCTCATCQLVRCIKARATCMNSKTTFFLVHYVYEAGRLTLNNADAICVVEECVRLRLTSHEYKILSLCLEPKTRHIALMVPAAQEAWAQVYLAQGAPANVCQGRFHGERVAGGVGTVWGGSVRCAAESEFPTPPLYGSDVFEGGMSHMRENKTCFVLRSWCCISFQCGGKRENVHLPLHLTPIASKHEGRLVTQCSFDKESHTWIPRVRREYGGQLFPQRTVKTECSDSGSVFHCCTRSCVWAKSTGAEDVRVWEAWCPPEFSSLFSKFAEAGVQVWTRCRKRLRSSDEGTQTHALSREQFCALASLLHSSAAKSVLDFFCAAKTPYQVSSRDEFEALWYSVFISYTPCLSRVADMVLDWLLCAMRLALGGAKDRDVEKIAARGRQLKLLQGALDAGCLAGEWAPFRDFSEDARKALLPATMLYYGSILTIRGPLPVSCQAGAGA